MTGPDRILVILGLQTVAILGLACGLVYYAYQQQSAGQETTVEVADVADASIEDWIPVERMDMLVGPWKSEPDGEVLVSIAAGSLDNPSLTSGPWRLSVEWEGHPFVICGVYSHLQAAGSPELPWRLAHCQGLGETPGTVLPTHVGFYRRPQWPFVRLTLGVYLEVDLSQVE